MGYPSNSWIPTTLGPGRSEKRQKAFEKAYESEAFVEFTCRQPCFVCGKRPSIPGHVAKTKGAGGGPEHVAPICGAHEDEFHAIGRHTFAERHHVDLTAAAAAHWAKWQKRP